MDNSKKLKITIAAIISVIIIVSSIYFVKLILSKNSQNNNDQVTTTSSEIIDDSSSDEIIETTETSESKTTDESTSEIKKEKSNKSFSELNNIGKYSKNYSYSIKYLNSGDEFNKNESLKLQTEGLVSLFIYYHIYKEIEVGNLTENTKMKNGKSLEYNANNMLIYSDYEAADLIIDMLGIQNINRAFYDYGYRETDLQRPYLYEEGRKKGLNNYTSSRDLLSLQEIIYNKDDLAGSKLNSALKEKKVNNKLLVNVPQDVESGNLTGDLDQVESEVVFVNSKQDPYIAVVLLNDITDINKERSIIQNIGKEIYEQSEK